MALRRVLPAPPERMRVDISLFIVNIVLLLILFFLATGQLLNSPSFAVEISETSELDIETLPAPILILDETGELTLDGAPVANDLLGPALSGLDLVHLLVPRDSPATDLIALLAREELARIEVRLVTIHYRDDGP